MVVKGKLLVGPVLALVGGIIMLFSGYFVFASIASIEETLALAALSWADAGFSLELMYLRVACTFLWGVMGIIGGIIAIIGKKLGSVLALIGGLLGVVGMFVPLGTITIVIAVPVTLSASFMLLDPIIIVLGGIIGLILKD